MTHSDNTTHPIAPCQRLLVLGGGELGRELVFRAKRAGAYVVVAARYVNAPASQFADEHHVIDMTRHDLLTNLIERVEPDLIIPEIEAVDIDALADAESDGIQVVPSARAHAICSNRREIRTLAADQLGMLTSRYAFAYSADELHDLAHEFGTTCHVKPLQSSSGKGQSTLPEEPTRMQAALAWQEAHAHGYRDHDHVMIEAHVPFEQEITLLTISTGRGVHFCAPIGHQQEDGDYVLSWQPAHVSDTHIQTMHKMAEELVTSLGGHGVFGVEFFICGTQVYFSEASPRPHDTGFVTLVTQDVDEFAAHILAATGRLTKAPVCQGFGVSGALRAKETHERPDCVIRGEANLEDVDVHIFGKPEAHPGRRMGVALTRDDDLDAATTRITAVQQAFDTKEDSI